MSVDVRTRSDGDEIDPPCDDLFGAMFPEMVQRGADRLEEPVRWLDPPPLGVRVDGTTWTLSHTRGSIHVRRTTGPARSIVDLDRDELRDLVNDHLTPMGLFSSGRLRLEGSLAHVHNWWLIVRGVLDGTAPTLPGEVPLTDADGIPLDLARSFVPGDDDSEMAAFLERAGYLHVRNLFTTQEMEAVSRDMDDAVPNFEQGDGRSWWATTSDGTERLVRMQRFDELSPTVAELLSDGRLARIAGLTGDGHQWSETDFNRVEALFKPIGVVSGISDVPWHKDCSLGRHSYDCCALTVGISVTGAGPGTGQLQVMAGSHRAHMWPALLQPGLDLPVVGLATGTGDITVHLSCALHMAEPPVTRERRVLYTGMRMPPRDAARTAVARARLSELRETTSVSVSQPPSPVAARTT